MKCQILLSGDNKKKYFKMSSAEIFTQHAECYSVYCQMNTGFCTVTGALILSRTPLLDFSFQSIQISQFKLSETCLESLLGEVPEDNFCFN